jgi:hypothetical protein
MERVRHRYCARSLGLAGIAAPDFDAPHPTGPAENRHPIAASGDRTFSG